MTTQASGQMEYLAEAMRPQYMSRDLVVFAEGLNLDDGQEVIIEAMFDSYEDDFAVGWAETQERINRVAEQNRINPPSSSMETLEPVLNALGDWLEEKDSLDVGLLENVKTILVNEQILLWPSFVQRLYREKTINRGRLSGEAVNLFQIVRDSNLPSGAENAIADHMSEYATALDVALHKRDAILRGNPKKLFDNILKGNASQSTTRVDSLISARVEVRDIHDRYIELISDSLASPDRENFRGRALKRGYPRIYRKTPAQRILRQAAESENHPADIIVLVLQLESGYLQELGSINNKLLAMTRKNEPELQRHRELAGQIRKQGGTPQRLEDPTREVYKDREELGRKYITMLRDLLSPEQFLELDGASRWLPRESQALPSPATINPNVPRGGRGTSKGKSKEDGKKKTPKEIDSPNPTGLANPKSGPGSGT